MNSLPSSRVEVSALLGSIPSYSLRLKKYSCHERGCVGSLQLFSLLPPTTEKKRECHLPRHHIRARN